MHGESINDLLQTLVVPPTRLEGVYSKTESASENDLSRKRDSVNEAIKGDHWFETSLLIWLVCLRARIGSPDCSQSDRTCGGTCSQHGAQKT